MSEDRARVLLADDSMVVRAVIRGQLATEPHELIEACDGDEALALVRRHHPDVVLLDVEMPGLTGYEVLSAMQTDTDLAHIPVVFLSGRVTADDVAKGLRLGAHDYLRKPVEPGELIARLTAALRSKRLHDRLRQDNDHLRELAPVDALTGALDIRGLQRCISELAARSHSAGSPLGAVLLDIDGLEQINAEHGWEGGDAVLRTITERTSRCTEADHVVGRCGPDELLVLLPGVGADEARRFAERLHYTVTDEPHALPTGSIDVNVCVGSGSVSDGDSARLLATVQQDIVAQKRTLPEQPPAAPLPESLVSVTPEIDLEPAVVRSNAPAVAASSGNAHLLARIRQQMDS